MVNEGTSAAVMNGRGGQPPRWQAGTSNAIAVEVRDLLERGTAEAAREHYGELVLVHQRRALRLAYSYLRDGADADEAVQDAFVKAFVHLPSFDPNLSFDVWFTRILVNGCLDRLKVRTRRARWMLPLPEAEVAVPPSVEKSPEAALLAGEACSQLQQAIDALPDRQRLVVTLSQLDGRSAGEIGRLTGLSESTVRVHLFRAMRKLRKQLTRVREATYDTLARSQEHA